MAVYHSDVTASTRQQQPLQLGSCPSHDWLIPCSSASIRTRRQEFQMIAQVDCVRVSYYYFAVLLSSKSSFPPPSIHTNPACEISLQPRIASLNAVTSARWDICNLAWNSGDFGSKLCKPLSLFLSEFSHPNHFSQQYHKSNWHKHPLCSRTFSYSNNADWGQIPQFFLQCWLCWLLKRRLLYC